jgi:hypothetical protein
MEQNCEFRHKARVKIGRVKKKVDHPKLITRKTEKEFAKNKPVGHVANAIVLHAHPR